MMISTRCVMVETKKGRWVWDVFRWHWAGAGQGVRGKQGIRQHLGVLLEPQDRSVIIYHQKPLAIWLQWGGCVEEDFREEKIKNSVLDS